MSSLTPAERVAAYIKLRDYIKSANDEFAKSLVRVKDAMTKLEGELLDDLNKSGANSLACDAGTVYKNTQMSATVENRDVFLAWLKADNEWEAADVKANKTFAKEFMEKHGQPLPGIKITQMTTVGVRRS